MIYCLLQEMSFVVEKQTFYLKGHELTAAGEISSKHNFSLRYVIVHVYLLHLICLSVCLPACLTQCMYR
jgi:hypothetical protein